MTTSEGKERVNQTLLSIYRKPYCGINPISELAKDSIARAFQKVVKRDWT